MTLYEIDSRLLELLNNAIDPDTGEFVANENEWEELQLARETKIENTGCYIKNLKAEAEAIKNEEAALRQRRTRLERKMEWLKGELSRSLAGASYESPRCVIRFRKNPIAVVYTAEDEAMQWAIEHRQDLVSYGKPVLSKSGLKKLLEEGEEIPGAELAQGTRVEVV